MSVPRPQKTLADYLAIAVTPLLIMLLVGSLIFFLQEVLYRGAYESRVRWIMFWFVVGAVLVARIAIESGRAQAALFTAGLGGATTLAIFRFAPGNPWLPIVFLAVIGWCADKLTWDCSLIDDSEDASGEGLLQVAGVAGIADAAPSADPPVRVPFWKRLLLNTQERKGRPHAPGLWVVYFSLAALPLFGFGQVMIPAGNEPSRHFAFQCLLVYVGAGLGLLMLTSFLGLRRYLRQRNMQMPTAMAATWVGMGAAIAVGILIVSLLLPRPQGDYSVVAMVDSVADKLQNASDRAFLDQEGGDGKSQQVADKPAPDKAKPDQPQRGPDGQPGPQQAQGQPKQGEQGQQGEQDRERAQGQPQPGESPDQKSSDKSGSNDQKPPQPGDQQGSRQPQSKDQPQGKQQPPDDAQQQEGQSPKGRQPEGQPPKNTTDGSKPGEQGQARPDEQQQDKPQDQQKDKQEQQKDEEQPKPDENKEAQAQPPEAEPPTPETPPEPGSNWFENLGTLFKLVVYGLVAAAMLYFAIRHRAAIQQFLQNLWNELLSLFGRRPATASSTPAEVVEEQLPPPRPFASFANPFASGQARRVSLSELVRYTFEALQAWGFEHDCPRRPDQTPLEFGEELHARRPECGEEAVELTQLYARVAYAGQTPDPQSMAVVEKLWRRLCRSSRPAE